MNQISEFKVLPKLVGTWEGNWIALDPTGKERYQFASILEQKIANNQWVQTNHNTYSDGRQETLHFFGKAVEENTLLLESPDIPYSDFLMLVSELGENLIIINVTHKITGIQLTAETINLVNPNERIRSLQQFNTSDGKLRGFTLVIEKKIST